MLISGIIKNNGPGKFLVVPSTIVDVSFSLLERIEERDWDSEIIVFRYKFKLSLEP
jgi:hypothetical protein